MTTLPVTFADIVAAREGLAGAIAPTPCTRSETLSAITGVELWCKFENLQYTASFKERGARWFLLGLTPEEAASGVVTASAGNHAQGVAHHARQLGIEATVVMPQNTPFTKVTRTTVLGARVILHGDDFTEAHARARMLAAESGATFVPAFDDPRVIAGQGTCALEILEQAPEVDTLVIPTGGGGLLAGYAVAAKALRPDVRIVGVQSETHPAFVRAWSGLDVEGRPGSTIAEGIAVAEPGATPLVIARELVDDMVVVGEQAIEEAVADYLEIEKVVVEGAGAASLAAVVAEPERFAGRNCALIVSGGNIDLRVLTSVVLRALARSGRIVRFVLEIPDRPGQLAVVAEIVARTGGNIIDVEHHRDRPGVAFREAILEVSVETRDRAHAESIAAAFTAAGIRVR